MKICTKYLINFISISRKLNILDKNQLETIVNLLALLYNYIRLYTLTNDNCILFGVDFYLVSCVFGREHFFLLWHGNTAQRLCIRCKVRFFVKFYRNGAGKNFYIRWQKICKQIMCKAVRRSLCGVTLMSTLKYKQLLKQI